MNDNKVTTRYRWLPLLLLALLFGACTSAEEILEDGIELEERGSYEEAAWKYIRALRKDGSLDEARERLAWVSDTLVADYFARSARAEAMNRPVEAAEAYLETDRLVSGAFEVGVNIPLPQDYVDRRREAFNHAIADLEEQARSARSYGEFGEANDLLRDASERFDPEPASLDRLINTRFDLLLAWADEASERGRFREAVRRADEALAVAENGAIDPAAAIRLRTAAMEAGTVYVAATPVWRSGRLARDMQPGFLADLNDRLELDFWSNPPEFIAFAHPALVRRRLRELNLQRRSLSRRDARVIARDLDADFAVVAEIERYAMIEKDIKEREKHVKTRSGEDAVYFEIRGRVEIQARLSYEIVDNHGNVVGDGTIDEHRSADFKRAEYDGRYRDLDISRGERDLFDSDRYDESLLEAEEKLAQRLAERIGRTVFDRVLSQVR